MSILLILHIGHRKGCPARLSLEILTQRLHVNTQVPGLNYFNEVLSVDLDKETIAIMIVYRLSFEEFAYRLTILLSAAHPWG